MKSIQLKIKRILDICIATFFLFLLTIIPVLIIIPILIKIDSKGPVVFKQQRIGKNGLSFKIYKFRTMRIEIESIAPDGKLIEPKDRITKIGMLLRKTSLDELMQLFNVINGTMSIVGPRPTLPYQVERYTEKQLHRLDMRPGITGWAQIHGRNNLTWTEKIEFDLYYIENFNLLMDVKIILKTVIVIFKHEGIEFSQDDNITRKKELNVNRRTK